MLARSLQSTILKAAKTFPCIVVTGPRQSGKTTLLKELFKSSHAYINLEIPDIRLRAEEDPIGFLNQISGPVILDEFQYVPGLLPYIKDKIDANRTPNRYVLTGSQNFVLMENVSESLAGRAAILTLLPLSLNEIAGDGFSFGDIQAFLKRVGDTRLNSESKLLSNIPNIILRGSYPEIVSNKEVDRQIWCGSYINTYLERDIRNIESIGSLSDFARFIRSCAVRTGQILNISDIAKDIGVAVNTARRWLSILETGYQIYLLYPYYRNIGKRLIKSPKLYFCDTGLASYLMGLNDETALVNNMHYGNLFETLVITDFLKRYLNSGKLPSMYYLRTQDKLEIDLALEEGTKLSLFEIKSASTITSKNIESLGKVGNELVSMIDKTGVISATDNMFLIRDNIWNIPMNSMLI